MTLPMRRALVAVDLGAESCRVSLLRWVGGAPRVELVRRFANSPVEMEGGLRWDLSRIERELELGFRACAAIAVEGIESVGIDGWAVDYVRLDVAGGMVEEPFCYRDGRTRIAEKDLHRRLSAERMRELTGVQIMALNTVYQMFADTDELKKMRWLNLPEYFLMRLGGRAVSEYTDATHTQMVTLGAMGWSGEVLEAAGLESATMPEIVAAGTDVGKVTGALAELAAFGNTRVIAPACHDTASAIAGIPDSGDDWAYISSGTWSLVGTLLDAPNNGEAARAANFTNLGAAGGRTCFHKNVNGMWMLKQCIESWAGSRQWTIEELVELAEREAAPGNLIDVDDADLQAAGGMPERINAQLQRRGLTRVEGAGAMVALILHSLAARYAEVLRSASEITGKRFRRIYVVGGGSRNAFLNRLTEQATGIEVRAGSAESSTIGNFAVQLATLDGAATASAVGEWARRLN